MSPYELASTIRTGAGRFGPTTEEVEEACWCCPNSLHGRFHGLCRHDHDRCFLRKGLGRLRRLRERSEDQHQHECKDRLHVSFLVGN